MAWRYTEIRDTLSICILVKTGGQPEFRPRTKIAVALGVATYYGRKSKSLSSCPRILAAVHVQLNHGGRINDGPADGDAGVYAAEAPPSVYFLQTRQDSAQSPNIGLSSDVYSEDNWGMYLLHGVPEMEFYAYSNFVAPHEHDGGWGFIRQNNNDARWISFRCRTRCKYINRPQISFPTNHKTLQC